MKTVLIVLFAFVAGVLSNAYLFNDRYPSNPDDAGQSEALIAWIRFTDRMRVLGARLQEDDLATQASLGAFPRQTDRDRAEGITQMAHMVVEGLRWEFDHADPKFPLLMISNTDTSAWGGPNVNNRYLRAKISDEYRYRLTGNLAGVREIAIQTTSGDMHMGEFGASDTIDMSGLSINESGNFSLTISQEAAEGDWLALDPEHTILSLRVYFADWQNDSEAKFYLVNLDTEGQSPPPATERDVARRLDNAAAWIEGSLVGWNRFMKAATLTADDNKIIKPKSVAGGSTTLAYGGVPLNLQPDEALIVNFIAPEASYWSFQTYSHGWFASGDYANKLTSLNMKQAHREADGQVWIVVAHQDPGLHNWIDTEGRQTSLLTHRWLNSEEVQGLSSSVVKFPELSEHLPTAVRRVTPEQRQQQLAQRRRHVQRQFHN